MKYIDNDIQKGIDYDYGKIRKSLKKKKVFVPDAYNPCDCPIEKSAWFIQLSERGIGKTTGWILFGMEMYMQYGTIIQYVRQSENMIMPKNTSDLFSVIIEHDYVSKITNGQYNNIKYKSRRWYFTKTDDDGNIIDEAKCQPKTKQPPIGHDKRLLCTTSPSRMRSTARLTGEPLASRSDDGEVNA